MIHESILDLIGNTPIIQFEDIYIKLESYNIGGSIKDRVAYKMIENLIKEKNIKIGSTVIEVTSGNTGIAIAMVCAIKRLKCIIIMLDNVSKEKIKIIKAYGGEVILTPAEKGTSFARLKAQALAIKDDHYFLDQYKNEANPLAHITTANEIKKEFDNLDYLVCGIGTGGTITGLGKELKKVYPNLQVIGVEPKELPFLSCNKKVTAKSSKLNGIQGIGLTFMPKVLDLSVIDKIETVSTLDTYRMYKYLAKEGLFLGLSSAANYAVSKRLLSKHPDSKVLMISADNGMKYLGVYSD